MTATIDYLPIWKKDATADERLSELAMMAKVHPERFNQFCLVYSESFEDKTTITRYFCHNTNTYELLGLLEMGKCEVLEYSRK